MHGMIYRYLADDHERLDALLDRAVANPDDIDASAYGEFRKGLLKHIGMEEKVLLPEARRMRGGVALPGAARLRLDHGALTALLVPSPTVSLVAAIRAILGAHNPVEEEAGGIYEQCEDLAKDEAPAILRRLQDYPEVKVLPHVDSPFVMDAARRALARADYKLEI